VVLLVLCGKSPLSLSPSVINNFGRGGG